MAKQESIAGTHSGNGPSARPPRGKRARRIARLEKELNRLAGEEQRRARRLTRTRQQASAVASRLEELRAPVEPRPRAYCLRDRRTVAVVDPRPVVLANGRHALSGTCEACGGRVTRMVARPVSLLTG